MYRSYLQAALAGLAIRLFTIYVLPAELELLLWSLLIVAIGYFTARAPLKNIFRRRFWHAVIIGISITLTHLILTNDYLRSHPEAKAQINNYAPGLAPQLVLLMAAPVYWLILGALSGLLAILWAKVRYSCFVSVPSDI